MGAKVVLYAVLLLASWLGGVETGIEQGRNDSALLVGILRDKNTSAEVSVDHDAVSI